MKTLKAIDDAIIALDGSEPNPNIKMPTYRMLLRIILNNQVPSNAEQSLDTHQILLKLRLVESDIKLENSEFKLLREKVAENQAKMFQGPHGQVLSYLDRCDKEPVTELKEA